MQLFGKTWVFVKITLIFSLVILFSLSGCTKYASKSQKEELERQKNTALAAESKAKQLNGEKRELQGILKEKKEELRELEDERDDIKAQLNK